MTTLSSSKSQPETFLSVSREFPRHLFEIKARLHELGEVPPDVRDHQLWKRLVEQEDALLGVLSRGLGGTQ